MKNKFVIFLFMLTIFPSKAQNRDIPDWANFFNQKEYNQFIDLIEKYFKEKKCKIQLSDGVIIAEDNDFGFNNLGIVNVAQTCKQAKQCEWKRIINDHFESLIESFKFDSEFQKIIDDFEKVKQYLGVKLYHIDFINSVGKENTVYRSITDEIVELLIFDLPTSVQSVKPEYLKIWERQSDELFDLGIKNINFQYQPEISEQKLGDIKIWFVQGDHLYATNIILEPDKMLRYIGNEGALIAIPHRHAVLIYPIESLEVTKAINILIPIINGMNIEGPGSISGKLYWYNKGKMLDLPYKLTDQKLEFYPPDEFVTVLNRLKE